MASVSPSSSLKPPIRWKEYEQTLTRLYQSWGRLSLAQQTCALEQVLEMRAAREQDPCRFLIPNGAQEKVIRDVGNMEYFIVLSCFANGVGKSAINIAILGAIMFGAPSTAFDYPLYREYPRRWPKLVRIATEPALVGHMGPIQVESKLWWPEGRYEWSKGGKQYNSFFETDTGFLGEVMTYEQAVKEFEGKTNAINLFVEPPPREILFACFARQRKGGLNMIDMTPLTSSAYIKDEIVDKPEIVVDGVSVGKVSCIQADIEENCEDHGKNGQLKHRDIIQIISRYDPDEVEARAHGNFMHLMGRVYKTFNRKIHVAAEPLIPPSDGVSFYVSVDPHVGKPFAVILAYADAAGVVHIYKEWPEYRFEGAKDPGFGLEEYAHLFKTLEEGRKIEKRIIDRHFANTRRNVGGNNLKQDFGDLGLDFVDSYAVAADKPEVQTGVLQVREYLAFDKSKPIDAVNRPRLIVSPDCRNTIESFEKWAFDPDKNEPQEQFKDFADVVRYLVMSEPKYEPPISWGDMSGPHYGVGTRA